MVKRKSLRFLSIALAVVVVGSALYYGTSKYISADIESDGEWAYIKNPTFDERRTIIFDAYISNRQKDENIVDVAHDMFVLEDDLNSGKVSKIPVDSLERYNFWVDYWQRASSRVVAGNLDTTISGSHIALAAEVSDEDKIETYKRSFLDVYNGGTYHSEFDDRTAWKIQDGFSLTLMKLRTGQVKIDDLPKDPTNYKEFKDYYEPLGNEGASFGLFAYRETSKSVRDSNLYHNDAEAYNDYIGRFQDHLQDQKLSWKGYSTEMFATAARLIYLNGYKNGQTDIKPGDITDHVKHDYDELLRITRNSIQNGILSDIYTQFKAQYNPGEAENGSAASKVAIAVQAAPVATSDGSLAEGWEGLFGDLSDEDLNYFYSEYFPEIAGIGTYDETLTNKNGTQNTNAVTDPTDETLTNKNGTQNTNAVTDPIAGDTSSDNVDYSQASAAAIRSSAATKASVAQKSAMPMERKGDPLASIYPVEETSGGQIGGDVEEDDSNALPALSEINTGWTGVGTVGINKKTGNFEYKSAIEYNGTDMGYMSFDPANARVDAEFHYTLAGKEVTLYAEPTTGEIYLELGNKNGDPLYAIGGSISTTELTLVDGQVVSKPVTKKVNGLMKVSVAKDGSIGGSFKLMGRVFNYNPTSKAFEIPINLDKGGLAGVGDAGGSKVLYLDSKGGVRGNITLLNKNGQTAGLYMTSAGTVALTYDISRVGGSQLGALSVDNNGVVNGTVNIGKVFGENNLDVFVGFGSDGVSSVNVPIGNIGGNALGLTVTKDGTLSLGSFVMVAGLPVPVNLTTNNTGGTVLNFFLFKFTFGGANEDEVLDPPSPVFTDEGAVNLNFVQMGKYEKTYGWFPPKTNRYYQRVFIELPEEEKYERAKIIFDKYNEHLGRNPSQEEFMQAYIYNSHMKIGTECRNMDEGGHQARVDQLKAALDGLITQNSWHLPDGVGFLDGNKREYDCIKAGTAPEKCEDRPTSLMPTSALEAFKVDAYDKLSEMSKEDQYKTIKEFLDAIEILAKDDPEIERIIQEFINNHEENPTTGLIGDGETVRFTNGFNTFVVPEYDQVILKNVADLASPTATASATATTSITATASTTLSPGALGTTQTFSGSSARLGYIDTAPFTNKGLEIFQYSASSTNKWLSTANGDSIPYMKAGVGYYIYNPGTTTGIEIKKADVAETAMLKPSLQKGWNLVANSTEKSPNLNEIIHSIVAGEDKTLVAMAKADEIHDRMYLIQDGTATEATKAFKLLNPLATDITAQIVGSLKPYWVYVK